MYRRHSIAGQLVVLTFVIALLSGLYRLSAMTLPVVRDLTVGGVTVFTPHDLLSRLVLRPGVPFSPAALHSDVESIAERFRKEGYLDVRVTAVERYASDSIMVDIAIGVEERRRTILGSLRITGNSLFASEELLGLLDSRIGSPLDPELLEADIAVVLLRYEKQGYPMARCTVDSMSFRGGGVLDSLSLTLAIDEGPAVHIREMRVQGNRETATGVILRESRIRTGELYDPDRMRAVRQRLLRLNIFASVSEPELYLHRDAGGVLIRVQEGNTNTFDGIAGYMPGTGVGEDGYVTGLVSVSMRNLFGTARKVHFRWQKEDRHSQELGLGYVEPWLFEVPLNIGLDFQQRRQDSSYVRQGGTLRAEWMFSEDLTVSLIGSSESVIPSADSGDARVGRSSTTSAGIEVAYDSRDDLYSPTAGARYRADYHYGTRDADASRSGAGTSGTVQHLTFDLESYRVVLSRQVVALGIHGRQVQGGAVDESAFYRFGGANSLRGYRENQFMGTRVGWMNLEYRVLLARRSFVYGFVDAGYYFRPAGDRPGTAVTEAFQYGYGLGFRFDSPLGNMGVSFALGRGDSFAQGKVHFGILNEF